MSYVRRSARFAAAIVAATVSLTACSSESDDTAADGTRGVGLGRHIEIRAGGSPVLATLWLDSVQAVNCTEPGSLPPNNGHYLAATIVLQTSEAYQPDSGWWMSAEDFTTENGEGKQTGKGIITSCLPKHRYLPDDFYLNDSGYYGIVLIDSASEHGTLTYKPRNLPTDVPGWHWKY
ncbi:hypothetical protein V5P93_000775 [Actinokineospora auranticolor]|uniref:DUF4352 domain-containing protein n=1 Tax=Actinokineospora auranticolor TaxID=155976 RepID=A0A2S6GYN1_9PSEU|nr:hypothetical protein [Actinokineospora auranticolor]PPK70345.1 hypothetical protein CLV40_102258 [Actinokineospora auranticolor]